MSPKDKPLVWLHGEVKSPPFGAAARLEAGFHLRRLQRGERLSLPHSRPMPVIGRVDTDAVVIAEVFSKKTQATPKRIIGTSKSRLKEYDDACE